MTSFKVTELNKDRNSITIIVTFDDSTTYEKRMMVSAFDEQNVTDEVKVWLNDYLPIREESQQKEEEALPDIQLNKSIDVGAGIPDRPVDAEA